MTLFNVFSLLGGLALFLFGMDIMGKALEKQAGGQQKQHRKNSHHDSAGGPPAGSARPACQTT